MGHGFRAERLAHPRRGGKFELKVNVRERYSWWDSLSINQ